MAYCYISSQARSLSGRERFWYAFYPCDEWLVSRATVMRLYDLQWKLVLCELRWGATMILELALGCSVLTRTLPECDE
jgi:hypothetical protein